MERQLSYCIEWTWNRHWKTFKASQKKSKKRIWVARDNFQSWKKIQIQHEASSYLTFYTSESFKELMLYSNRDSKFKVLDCKIIYIMILILYAAKFSKYLGLGLKLSLGNQCRKMDPEKYKACPFNAIFQFTAECNCIHFQFWARNSSSSSSSKS